MDRLDLLAVQGTLKSFLQHHSLKAGSHTQALEMVGVVGDYVMLMTGEEDAHHGGNALGGLSLGSVLLRPHHCFPFRNLSSAQGGAPLCVPRQDLRPGHVPG